MLPKKNRKFYIGITNFDRHLCAFEQDTDGHWCRHSTTCPGLSEVSKHLESIKKAPESLPDNELHTENGSAAERTYGQQCEASSHGHSPGSSVAPVTIGEAGRMAWGGGGGTPVGMWGPKGYCF